MRGVPHPLPPLILLGALLGACNGPDLPNVSSLVPEIGVAPEALAFGEQAVPLPASLTLFVTNGGRATLEMDLSIEGEGADAYGLGVQTAEVGANESLEIEVGFLPKTYLVYEADLVITSNDEDNAELRIPLTGTGVSAPLPDISVSAQSVDFGEVEPGEVATEIFLISNVGTAPLELTAVQRSGSGAFGMYSDPSGNTIAPGNDLPVVITYDPAATSEGDSGQLTLVSNDPDEGSVPILLIGNGGADFEYPVAHIDCPGITAPPAFVRLDGAGSEDPEGYLPLTYEWTLAEVPSNTGGVPISDGYITNNNGGYTELFADAVGTYVVELVVENAIGVRSTPATCEILATPEEDILVELTWDTTNADLDLHLAQAGNALFQRPGDANWCNPRPDWGTVGGANDPSLDLDDRAGKGPENINIEVAADGMYDVRVHYFDDQGDDLVTATVRVYTRGEITPAFESFRLMSRNEVWDAARVNWPAGTVAALSVPLYDAENRQCFTP
jgi:hypothetical protein